MSPALTISTNVRSRSASPARPPVSPITPTLPPAQIVSDAHRSNNGDANGSSSGGGPPPPPTVSSATLATAQTAQPPRVAYVHSQADQVGVLPPAPIPMSLESNPDAIALRSAISILQMQKMRATADIQTLDKIKNEALEHPEEFLKDLVAGKTGGENKQQQQQEPGVEDGEVAPQRTWNDIPKAQDIYRCPPINWSQYAVVGDSLDKLHAEQISRPTQGTPGSLGAGGMYEFKGGDGKQEEYRGISSPLAPLRDKIEKKPKIKK